MSKQFLIMPFLLCETFGHVSQSSTQWQQYSRKMAHLYSTFKTLNREGNLSFHDKNLQWDDNNAYCSIMHTWQQRNSSNWEIEKLMYMH
jgi:hypothetical protein